MVNPTTKKLLVTFDYELFLGHRSGSVDNCLLRPTERLLKIFADNKFRSSIFFVDTTYLLRLRDLDYPAAKDDYGKVSEQLRKIVGQGHYIFPHIHPHWLDAKYLPDLNQWELIDIAKYRFHNISDEERENLFVSSVELLTEIGRSISPEYKVDGYRAGGWCIQPFSDFNNYFIQTGITTDFSVMRDMKNLTNAQFYDFSRTPMANIYHFEDEVTHEKLHGRFREITISTIEIPSSLRVINKFLLKFLWRTGNRNMGDGQGVIPQYLEENKSKEVVKHEAGLSEMVSIELLTSLKLGTYKNYIDQENYMHFISHPKMLSRHNLSMFRKFLRYAKGKHILVSNFREM